MQNKKLKNISAATARRNLLVLERCVMKYLNYSTIFW
jgi:hypothetical protein